MLSSEACFVRHLRCLHHQSDAFATLRKERKESVHLAQTSGFGTIEAPNRHLRHKVIDPLTACLRG